MRAILTAIHSGDHLFTVDRIQAGGQPHHVAAAQAVWGMDPRWFSVESNRWIRHGLVSRSSIPESHGEMKNETPQFRKTHELFRHPHSGPEPFPAAESRAAVVIVRDPRAVACSWAPFFGVSLAKAAGAVCDGQESSGRPSPARMVTEQPWGSWSGHCEAWLGGGPPFPVRLVKYEDLSQQPIATVRKLCADLDWDVSQEAINRAVKRTEFERLQRDESTSGFQETSPFAPRFFRSGKVDAWQQQLPEPERHLIEKRNREWMERLGYDSFTT